MMRLHALTVLTVLFLSRTGSAQDQEVRENWPNGKLRLHGRFKDGQEDGRWERYYESGQIALTSEYADGVLNGKYVKYYRNGQQATVRTYRAGERHGRCMEYYESGELLADVTYEDGKAIELRCLYRDGVSMSKEATELTLEVRELDQLSNVDARKCVRAYFDLAGEHLARGHKQDAEDVLGRGLKIDPGHCEGQLTLARLEAERKEFASAGTRLRFVLEHSKDPKLTKAAEEMLSSPTLDENAAPSFQLVLPNRILYVLPIADADMRLVHAVVERIKTDFGVGVQILDAFDLAETSLQESQLAYLQQFVARILQEVKPEGAAKLFERAGVDRKEDLSGDDLRRLVKTYVEAQKDGRRTWNEIAAQLDSQLDADLVQAQVAQRYPDLLSNPNVLGILAITSRNIRLSTYRFVFGNVSRAMHVGVITYDKFRWGNPSFELLTKRTVMQSFSSAGILIGIDRCTTPTCARAYPHDLREQDRKDDTMCPRCLSSLRELYARLSTPDARKPSDGSKRAPGE